MYNINMDLSSTKSENTAQYYKRDMYLRIYRFRLNIKTEYNYTLRYV